MDYADILMTINTCNGTRWTMLIFCHNDENKY